MSLLDPHSEAVTVAAFRWAMRNRLDEMRECVGRLDRVSVLEQLRSINRLQVELLNRLHVTTDEVIAAHERAEFAELVAMAALSPDGLPDDMGDGFAINGRNR